jgi:hypothetical protein
MKHPADRIRAQTLVILVGLALLARDVLKVRRWAGEARSLERDARQRHAREVNDLDDEHLRRIDELQAEIGTLRAKRATGERPPAEPSSPAGPAA